jgi:hypothetical protein
MMAAWLAPLVVWGVFGAVAGGGMWLLSVVMRRRGWGGEAACTFCEAWAVCADTGGGVLVCDSCELLGAPCVVDWVAGDGSCGGWCDDCGVWFDPGEPGGFSDCDAVGRVWSVHEQVVSGICAQWQCCTVCRLARWRRASVEDPRPVEGVVG